MQFRIGMHSGEVVVDSGRIYGSGINIAARLERLARPGGICISDLVRDELDATPPLEDIGPQHVKNIPTRFTRSSSTCRARHCQPPAQHLRVAGDRGACRSRRPKVTEMRSTSPTA